jgi:hypothetical protein
MPGQDMRLKFHLVFLRQRTSALQDSVEAARGRAGLLLYFFDKFRHVIDLLDRNHVKFGIVLPGNRQRQFQRAECMLGAIIGLQDFIERVW